MGGGAARKLMLRDLPEELMRRIGVAPAAADYAKPFLHEIAVDLFRAGKKAVATLGAVLNFECWMSKDQPATPYDRFVCLLDNTGEGNGPYFESLEREGFPMSRQFQIAMIENEVEFNNLPPELRRQYKEITKKSLLFPPIDLGYYFYLIDAGLGLKKTGRNEDAINCFKTAVLLQPDNLLAYGALAGIYLEAERNVEAIAVFDQLILISPPNSRWYFQRGEAKLKIGQKEAALADFKEALRLDPHNIDVKFHMAVAYGDSQRYNEALAVLETIEDTLLPQKGHRIAYYTLMLGLLLRLKKYAEAVGYSVKALREDPGDPYLVSYRITVQLYSNDASGALATVDRALQLQPGLPFLHYSKAFILLHMDKRSEAIAYIRANVVDDGLPDSAIISLIHSGSQPETVLGGE
jgi:tetratricopeptide (TPR) repeat protein